MTKEQAIEYWTSMAIDDWKSVEVLFKSKRYLHALFFAHLVLEKWLKAHWAKDNVGNTPPKIHHLVKLAKMTSLDLDDEILDFLREFNDFQLEGRYPDYLSMMHKKCNKKYTQEMLNQVIIVRECLQDKML